MCGLDPGNIAAQPASNNANANGRSTSQRSKSVLENHGPQPMVQAAAIPVASAVDHPPSALPAAFAPEHNTLDNSSGSAMALDQHGTKHSSSVVHDLDGYQDDPIALAAIEEKEATFMGLGHGTSMASRDVKEEMPSDPRTPEARRRVTSSPPGVVHPVGSPSTPSSGSCFDR